MSYPFLYLLSHLKYANPRFLILYSRQGSERYQRLLPFATYSLFAHWSSSTLAQLSTHRNRQWLHSEEPRLCADTTSVPPVAANLLVSLTISVQPLILIWSLISTTGPVQKIITAEKGVSLDFESLSRDAQAQSKELYMWGQNEQPDVKDGR